MNFFTLKVVEIIKETDDSVTICFKQPMLKKISYQPGQYLTLVFRINNRRYIRPYSFSSAPGIDATLNITVKRVPAGIVSNHIIDKVAVGDVIEVMPPMGDFLLDWEKINDDTSIVFWGAGSGITPLISMAKFMLNGYKNHITLVYGNRDTHNIIFASTITSLKKEYVNLKVWHFHSKAHISNIDPDVIEGRIAPARVIAVMKEINKLEDSLHYICGPTGLKESVKVSLINAGVDEGNIYSEDFEIVKDPKEFENVITRSVTIIKDNVATAVEVVKGKSILEAGLDAGIELSYACQTGNCSVCKGLLTNGEVKTVGLKKHPSDIAENEFLLCCTHPISENVEFKV